MDKIGHPTDCGRQSRRQTVGWVYQSPPARQAGQEGSRADARINGGSGIARQSGDACQPGSLSIPPVAARLWPPGPTTNSLPLLPPIKGKAVARLCPAEPSTDLRWSMPLRLPTGERTIAREPQCQRDRRCPESAKINIEAFS